MFANIFVIIVLLLCSGFFSGSETALFSLSRVQIHSLKNSSGKSASRLFLALRRPRETLITILLGNEFINISISVVSASLIAKALHVNVETETLISVLSITPLVLVFGEIIPKNIALRHAAQFSQFVIWPLGVFYKLVSPLRVVLTWFTDRVVKLFGGSSYSGDHMVMEDEYRRLVDLGEKEGVIDEEEKEVIHNIFEFTDKVVSDIMTHVDSIFMLSLDMPYERTIEEIKCTQYSRVPFYDDDRSNVSGILHVRDLIKHHRKKKAGEACELSDVMRPPIFVHPKTPLEKLLKEFQKTHMHMAIVRDGDAVLGLVTMDDVLEELFGEIEE